MKTALLAALTGVAAFANSNAGSKVYICATPQQSDLDQAGYEALVWVEIGGLGSHGQAGSNTNILSYDTWADAVIKKAKGLTDAGSPEIEVARDPLDPGQQILAAASRTNLNYAFKMERNDKPSTAPTALPTVIYNRGLVTGPARPFGRNEDFDLEVYTTAFNQLEVVVNPSAGGNPPLNTVLPAVTGTAQVGQTLTSTTGTWTGDATITYARQWLANNVPIPGATLATYIPTSDTVGKVIAVRVMGTNPVGVGVATSAPTAVVIA